MDDWIKLVLSPWFAEPFKLQKITHHNETYVATSETKALSIKIVPSKFVDRLTREYALASYASSTLGVQTPPPLELQTKGDITYLIRPYVSGQSLMSIMTQSMERFGFHCLEAGRQCALLHQKRFSTKGFLQSDLSVVPAPIYTLDEFSQFIQILKDKKVLTNIALDKLKGLDISSYYEGYPNVFCHSDYQPNNIIVGEDAQLYLIDFEWASAAPMVDDLACFEVFLEMYGAVEFVSEFYTGYQQISPIPKRYYEHKTMYKLYRLITMASYQANLQTGRMTTFYDRTVRHLQMMVDQNL